MTDTLHVIGAGIAGLACAVTAAQQGHKVVLYEATKQAGGRCRSFYDPNMERTIDNGSHAILGANPAVFKYLETIGASNELMAVNETGEIPFVDIETGENWTLRPDPGLLQKWIFNRHCRAPKTRSMDYIRGLSLLFANKSRSVASVLPQSNASWDRFWEPLSTAVTNTPGDQASARLLGAALWQALKTRTGGFKSYVPRTSLDQTFIKPAIESLRSAEAEIRFNAPLVSIEANDRVSALQFRTGKITLSGGDAVALALPPWSRVIRRYLGNEFDPSPSPIVNAHFQVDETLRFDAMTGIVGGTAQWAFSRPGLVSATVSADQNLAALNQQEIASRLWTDVRSAYGLSEQAIPPHRVIVERRATPLQNTDFVSNRPGPRTQIRNLFMAGDWLNTGLPCTLESAVRSGFEAATLAFKTT